MRNAIYILIFFTIGAASIWYADSAYKEGYKKGQWDGIYYSQGWYEGRNGEVLNKKYAEENCHYLSGFFDGRKGVRKANGEYR